MLDIQFIGVITILILAGLYVGLMIRRAWAIDFNIDRWPVFPFFRVKLDFNEIDHMLLLSERFWIWVVHIPISITLLCFASYYNINYLVQFGDTEVTGDVFRAFMEQTGTLRFLLESVKHLFSMMTGEYAYVFWGYAWKMALLTIILFFSRVILNIIMMPIAGVLMLALKTLSFSVLAMVIVTIVLQIRVAAKGADQKFLDTIGNSKTMLIAWGLISLGLAIFVPIIAKIIEIIQDAKQNMEVKDDFFNSFDGRADKRSTVFKSKINETKRNIEEEIFDQYTKDEYEKMYNEDINAEVHAQATVKSLGNLFAGCQSLEARTKRYNNLCKIYANNHAMLDEIEKQFNA